MLDHYVVLVLFFISCLGGCVSFILDAAPRASWRPSRASKVLTRCSMRRRKQNPLFYSFSEGGKASDVYNAGYLSDLSNLTDLKDLLFPKPLPFTIDDYLSDLKSEGNGEAATGTAIEEEKKDETDAEDEEGGAEAPQYLSLDEQVSRLSASLGGAGAKGGAAGALCALCFCPKRP